MPKSRLEAFSDCVIAFAITLLILDIHLEDVRTNIDNAGMIQALLASVLGICHQLPDLYGGLGLSP